MSKTYLLVICLLFASFTGCLESENEENLDRYVIASGTASTTSPSGKMADVWIHGHEDSMETYLQAIMTRYPDMTREEALEACSCNSTHHLGYITVNGSVEFGGWPYNETWADYDAYGWKITLLSGEGTWDVIWLNSENTIRANNKGPAFLNSSFSELDQRGMNKSGSKGPVEKPEQTCSGDPDNDWMTPYGFQNNCEQQWDLYRHGYAFLIVNTGETDLVLEWTVYGWK